MIEKEVEKVFSELSDSFSELKAETLVAEILENSILEYSDINISNKSIFSRGYSRDVVGYKKNYSNDKECSLDIHLSRNGIYDKLPQAIFHDFHSPKQNNLSYKEHRRLRKQEEKDARIFFQPIENEFFNQNLEIEKKERFFINRFDILRDNFLINFWNIDLQLSEKFMLKFLKLLPYASKISGNIKLVRLVLEKIINEKITIVRKDKSYMPKNKRALSNGRTLGIDFTLEVKKSTILNPELNVYVGPVPSNRIHNYSKGTPILKFLDVFYNYFIPMEFDVKTHITSDNSKETFAITKINAPILGLNTTI